MEFIQPNFSYLALLFGALLFSGFVVSRLGQPYPTSVFTVHKFVGLGLGAWLVKIVYDRYQFSALEASQTSLLGFTIFLFTLTVAAGGLLSVQAEGGLKNFSSKAWRGIEWMHHFLPYLILFSTLLLLYRLFF